MGQTETQGSARSRDGRRLAWCRYGPVDGAPVLLLHGAYGGRLMHHVHGEYERVGACVVTFDRPGFGLSDRHPGRRVVDGADDVVSVADHLGLDRFAVLGVSSGGQYALATAARHPERVTRCATVVMGAPLRADGFDAIAHLPEDLREDWRAMVEGDEAHLVADYEETTAKVAALRDATPEAGDEADHAMVVDTLSDALGAGPWGYVDEWVAEQQPWGFDLADVRAPVRMLVARGDRTVPAAHVEWLAERLPDVEVEWTDGDHMAPRREPEERLLAWLVAGAAVPARGG